MKGLIFTLALVLCVQAHAQYGSYEQQPGYAQPMPKKKVVLRYDDATDTVVEEAPQQERIVILNSQAQSQGQYQVQEQPQTLIQASPLVESGAERMRRAREDMEKGTEQKIVEKLEQSRMEDERARADRLFGNSFVAPTPTPVPVYPSAPPQPVQVVVPQMAAPVEEYVEPRARPLTREEMRAELESLKSAEEKPAYQSYISGMVGFGEYPDVVNVKGSLATGFSLGVITPERVVVEGSLLFSEYEIDTAEYYLWDLSQYNISTGLKYQLLPGRIRPTVGALASYTYRSYTNPGYFEEVTTNSFDVGVGAGLDVMLTNAFGVGADFRYLMNVANRANSSRRSPYLGPQYGTPVEELEYYMFTLNGKFTF